MDRYHFVKATPIPAIELEYVNIKNEEEGFLFTIMPNDKLSILYIRNIHEVGRRKEFVIHCRVISILYRKDNMICTECDNPDTVYGLLVDAGTDYKHMIAELNLHNILDINKYPYHYDLYEDIKVVPNISMDGFFVDEITYPQRFDVSTRNDPLLGDYDFDEMEDYNERKFTKLDES